MFKPIYLVETWRDVTPDLVPWIKPNAYKVSSFGQVYSYLTNKILSSTIVNDYYYHIGLRTSDPNSDNGTGTHPISIHRLVLMVFNPIPFPENYDVHHIDSNPGNNRLDNLMWVDKPLHARLGMRYGNFHPEIFNAGERCGTHVLTEKQVLEIVDLINTENYSLAQIARMYNVEDTTIHAIAHHYHWKHLDYDVNLRKSTAFTNEELDKIYKYLESHDISNKDIYKTQREIIEDCFKETGLGQKYEYEHKRKQMHRIITKHGKYEKLGSDYDFEYTVPLRVMPKKNNNSEKSSTTNENIDI